MAITAIIIDDEIMARNLLKGMLEEFCTEVQVLDSCHDLPSGIVSIRKNNPDIVFLDIEMPGYSGLEILNFFTEDEINFSIIFTTSYNEYAVSAFKLSATDYLLKPIDPKDLINSINLFKKRNLSTNYQLLKKTLVSSVTKKIPVHTSSSIIYLPMDQIIFMKAEGAYTKIFKDDGTTVLASKGLKHFEDIVSSEKYFLRTHKSYIANINYVSELVKSNGGYLKIKDFEISISTEKIPLFLELMRL